MYTRARYTVLLYRNEVIPQCASTHDTHDQYFILPHCLKNYWKTDCSEGRESDESPGVFATLMFQMPSVVEGGVFTVSDPSSQSPVTSLMSPSAAAAAAAASRGEAAHVGRSISFSGATICLHLPPDLNYHDHA